MNLPALLATLERRAQEADAIGATAPVASVYRQVLEELRPLAGDGNGTPAAASTNGDGPLLSAEDVAKRLGTSTRWVYDHADQLGVKRLSRRCVRFAASAVARYAERRR